MYSNKNIFPSLFDGILNKNVVTNLGFGIPLIIGASVDLKTGAVVCILMLVVNLLVCPLFGLLGSVPKGIKIPLSSICAIIILYFCSGYLGYFSKELLGLGFYLTLITVNSILLENISMAPNSTIGSHIATTFSQTLGFSLIMFIMSATRELLAKGSLWGLPITKKVLILNMGSAQAVFMGFLLLGMLIVALRLLKVFLVRHMSRQNKKSNLTERRG